MSAAATAPVRITKHVSGLGSLSLQLTRARFATRQGESLLYLASVLAYVIGSAAALTIAAGTTMFWNRWQQPTGVIAEAVAQDASFDSFLGAYFLLAVIACALLVPTMVGLSSSAAVLGARGREQRLAALRLLGLSSTDVTRMSLIDTLLQAGIGSVLGLALYLATLPAWGLMSFQATPLSVAEMTLPWWGIAAVLLSIIVIGLASSWWGLRQVHISPLGVARRATRPGLKLWRVFLFVGIVVVASATMMIAPNSGIVGLLIFAGVILVVIWGINLLGPWLLEKTSRALAGAGSPSVMWAARRVAADPKQTWSRVSGIGLLSLIGGFMAMLPISVNAVEGNGSAIERLTTGSLYDFSTGALLTIAFGLVLTAASILITQASAVLERADQSRALTKMGAPRAYLTRVSWLETLGPLVVSMLIGTFAGLALGRPMVNNAEQAGVAGGTTGVVVLSVVLLAGVALAVGALAASMPLQRQVLADRSRPAD